MSSAAKKRALCLGFFLAACFTGFSYRLVHLQVGRRDELSEMAEEKHVARQKLTARRGAIIDVHGETLAQNEPVKTVLADGSLLTDHAAVARILAPRLKMTEPALLEKLTRKVVSAKTGEKVPSQYIVLKKEVPEADIADLGDTLAAAKQRGIFTEQDSIRVYPNGAMAAHIVGFTSGDEGMEGVERSMDSFLRGHDGHRDIEHDRVGRELVAYRGGSRAPWDGHKVRLTIDMGLQGIVESELARGVKEYRPKTASIVMMNPKTGDIMALANAPTYDLNALDTTPAEHRKNHAIAGMVEPGSTFKIVTIAAALSERIVRKDTYIWCENNQFTYGGRALHDHRPYGDLSVPDVLIHSSNIGCAKLAIQLGDQKFYEYVRRFGFGERTGVQLPYEIGGWVHPPHRWSKISITRMPMGHEVGATPLQVASAMCAIANGGKLMLPQIVREVTDENGGLVAAYEPVELRRVATEQACEIVREALIQVCGPKGTAALARVAGYKVAGKTGTSQKTDESKRYGHSKYVASFVGYMPAENPEFVLIVLFDEAQTKPGAYYGGAVAAPIFSRIAARAARYLNLEPTEIVTAANAPSAEQLRDQ